jgi:hypothetical protein
MLPGGTKVQLSYVIIVEHNIHQQTLQTEAMAASLFHDTVQPPLSP